MSKKKKETKEEVEAKKSENTKITDKITELSKLVNDEAGGSGVMLCLVMGEKGIHMAMTGTGEDISVLVASAMTGSDQVGAVLAQGGMMAAMRKQEQERVDSMDENGAEEAPADMPSPTTEA